MIICPDCGRPMEYKEGTSWRGKKYEFYGCSGYPDLCRRTVEVSEAKKYDDGKKYERPERTLEEEAEEFADLYVKGGGDWETASYLRHRWEKDR